MPAGDTKALRSLRPWSLGQVLYRVKEPAVAEAPKRQCQNGEPQAAETVVGTDLFPFTLCRFSPHTLGEWRTVWRQPGFPLPHRQYANSAEFQKPGADRLFAEPGNLKSCTSTRIRRDLVRGTSARLSWIFPQPGLAGSGSLLAIERTEMKWRGRAARPTFRASPQRAVGRRASGKVTHAGHVSTAAPSQSGLLLFQATLSWPPPPSNSNRAASQSSLLSEGRLF